METKSRVLTAAGLFGTGCVFPAVSLTLLPYSRLFYERKDVSARVFLLYAACIAFLLAMLNAGKLVEADEENYFFMFDQMRHVGDLSLFTLISDTTGRSEVLFYAISYLLFGVLGLSFKAVTVFWTFFAYLISAISFLKFFKERATKVYALAVFTFCVTFFVNFALTAQIMRQYAAGSLVLLAFASFDKKVWSLLLISMATFIHNSALVFVIPWGLAAYSQWRAVKAPSFIVSLLIVGALFGFASYLGDFLFASLGGLSDSFEHLYNSSLKDDGDLTIFKVASIILSTVVLFYSARTQEKENLDLNVLPLFFAILYLGLLLFLVRQFPLLLLRFSFYADFFSFIAFSILFFRLVRFLPELAVLALPLLANVALIIRVSYSPWTYSWLAGNAGDNLIFALILKVINV